MRRGRCAMLVGAAVCVAGGCTTWRRDGRLTAAPAAAAGEDAVRVTRDDGRRVVLRAPRLAGDTLVAAGNTRVPLAAVRRVDRRRVDVDRTIFLVIGTMTAFVVVLLETGGGLP